MRKEFIVDCAVEWENCPTKQEQKTIQKTIMGIARHIAFTQEAYGSKLVSIKQEPLLITPSIYQSNLYIICPHTVVVMDVKDELTVTGTGNVQ